MPKACNQPTLRKLFSYKLGRGYISKIQQLTGAKKKDVELWVAKDFVPQEYQRMLHPHLGLYYYQLQYICSKSVYFKGFTDALEGTEIKDKEAYFQCHSLSALYQEGVIDAVMGDDMPSLDYQQKPWDLQNKGWYFNLMKG
jgi:hypothetical protein